MKLVLPYPPSANNYWRHVGRNVVVSKEAKVYRMRVLAAARPGRACGVEPFAGDVSVTVDIYRPRRIGDLDNTLKVLIDALRGIAYVDDSQITEIHATRMDDKANPRAVVTVESAAGGEK